MPVCLTNSVLFRCVPDSQRSFGLGIQWIVVRTFGRCVYFLLLTSGSLSSGFILFTQMPWSCPICHCCFSTGGIPGPIAFGSVIDISCLLWQDQCGQQGSCYLYQNSAMSQYTLVAGIIYKVMLYIVSGHLLQSYIQTILSFEKFCLWGKISVRNLLMWGLESWFWKLQHP